MQIKQAGFQPDPEQFTEKTGYKVTLAPTPAAPGEDEDSGDSGGASSSIHKIQNRDLQSAAKFEDASGRLLAQGLHEDMGHAAAHVQDLLNSISQIQDEGLRKKKFAALLAQWPAITADTLMAPASADAMQRIIGTSLARGLQTSGASARNRKILNGDVPGHEFHGNQWTELQDEHWTGTPKEMRQRAEAIMRTHTTSQHPVLGEIKLSGRQGRNKTLGPMKTPHEFQSVQAIPETTSKGTLILPSQPDRKGRSNVVAVHRLERNLKIGETKYKATALIRETKDGTKTPQHFYLHRIDPIANKKTGSPICMPAPCGEKQRSCRPIKK